MLIRKLCCKEGQKSNISLIFFPDNKMDNDRTFDFMYYSLTNIDKLTEIMALYRFHAPHINKLNIYNSEAEFYNSLKTIFTNLDIIRSANLLNMNKINFANKTLIKKSFRQRYLHIIKKRNKILYALFLFYLTLSKEEII